MPPLKLNNNDSSKIIIAGKLKDKETNESIPFATVVIRQGDNILSFGECDDDGNFHVELIKRLYSYTKVDVPVNYMGYEPLKIQDLPIETSSVYLDLSMMSNVEILGELVIGYPAMINTGQTSTSSVLTQEEISHLPK